MRTSLRRLGVRPSDLIGSSLGASERDLMENSYIRGSVRGSRSIDFDSDTEDASQREEELLCDMFRSNIGHATARARRRSVVG